MAHRPSLQIFRLLSVSMDGSIRTRLALAVVFAFATSAFAAFTPAILARLVDAYTREGVSAVVWLLLAINLLMIAGARVLEALQAYAFATADQGLQHQLAKRMFRRLLSLPIAFHVAFPAGGVMQVQAQALQASRSFLTQLFFVLLPALLQIALTLLVLAWTFDGALWLVVTGAMASYAVVFAWGIRRLALPTQAALTAQIETSSFKSDAMTNIEGVKSFCAEDLIAMDFEARLAAEQTALRTVQARRAQTSLAAGTVFALATSAALVLGLLRLDAGHISIGDFVLLSAYMLQIARPVEMLGFATRELAQAGAGMARWLTLEDRPLEEAASAHADHAMPAPAPATPVRFLSVSFQYPGTGPVFSAVSFMIPAGCVAAIVGPSGAGKSTLLRLILGYYAPTEGRVEIGGVSTEAKGFPALRRQVAHVSQDIVLFNRSLRYNLLLAQPDATEADLQDALSRAGLTPLVDRLTDGLDTVVGERGQALSGGERQRVAIARALLRQSPVIAMDEATASLDPTTEAAVLEQLLQLAPGKTLLIVTHRMPVAARADLIIALDRNGSVDVGDHHALLTRPGVYADMWRAHSDLVHVSPRQGARSTAQDNSGAADRTKPEVRPVD